MNIQGVNLTLTVITCRSVLSTSGEVGCDMVDAIVKHHRRTGAFNMSTTILALTPVTKWELDKAREGRWFPCPSFMTLPRVALMCDAVMLAPVQIARMTSFLRVYWGLGEDISCLCTHLWTCRFRKDLLILYKQKQKEINSRCELLICSQSKTSIVLLTSSKCFKVTILLVIEL